MRRHVPRKLSLGFKPFRNMTVRQVMYLVLFGGLAMVIVVTGVSGMESLIARLLIAGVVVTVGVVLAFAPLWGSPLDTWLPRALGFLSSARRRVWTKRGGMPPMPLPVSVAPPAPPMPPVTTPAPPPAPTPQPVVAELPRPAEAPRPAETPRMMAMITHYWDEVSPFGLLFDAAVLLAVTGLIMYLMRIGL
jgi:hypothetical protein